MTERIPHFRSNISSSKLHSQKNSTYCFLATKASNLWFHITSYQYLSTLFIPVVCKP